MSACGCVDESEGTLGGQRHQISWGWSHIWLWAARFGFREPNFGLLKDQEILLPGEPSLQYQFLYFFERRLKHDPV